MSGDASTPRDAAAVRVPPTLVYLAAILVGVALHRFVWRFPLSLATSVRVTIAVADG